MIITKLRNIIIYVPTDSFQGHESLLCNMIKMLPDNVRFVSCLPNSTIGAPKRNIRPLIFNIHAMENL